MDIYLDRNNLAKRRCALRLKFYAIFALIILIIIGVIYLVIYSPIFKIKNFTILGNERMKKDEVVAVLKDYVFGALGWQNIFSWPRGEITPDAGLISNATVKKNWFKREIFITIKERTRFAIWCFEKNKNNSENCFWLDKDAVIFEKAPSGEGGLIFTISDPGGVLLNIGNKILDSELGINLIKILSYIDKLDFPPKNITYNRELQELKIETYGGPILLFSLRFSPETSIDSLENLSQSTTVKNVEYIDLRIENKIYYKNK